MATKKIASLVIGMGEVGTALYKVLNRSKVVYARDVKQTDHDNDQISVLHIAFPYSMDFVNQVRNYIELYSPDLVIVYSSVPIGTCAQIGENIVHSPIEGKHPSLEDSILISPRWLGCIDPVALEQAVQFWVVLVSTVRTLASANFTEFLKLRSTSKFGLNLAWADYEKQVADELGMDYSALQNFDIDYNILYQQLNMNQFQRYILAPPEGVIGGHCVVPNAELLNEQYPSPMLDEITKLRAKDVV